MAAFIEYLGKLRHPVKRCRAVSDDGLHGEQRIRRGPTLREPRLHQFQPCYSLGFAILIFLVREEGSNQEEGASEARSKEGRQPPASDARLGRSP